MWLKYLNPWRHRRYQRSQQYLDQFLFEIYKATPIGEDARLDKDALRQVIQNGSSILAGMPPR